MVKITYNNEYKTIIEMLQKEKSKNKKSFLTQEEVFLFLDKKKITANQIATCKLKLTKLSGKCLSHINCEDSLPQLF